MGKESLSWSGILTELIATGAPGARPDYDGVRRKYLSRLAQPSHFAPFSVNFRK